MVSAPSASGSSSTGALARRMLGGTNLGERAQVTLYWESYGFAPGDSLEVTITLTRLDRGALSRLAGALHVPGFDSDGRDAASVRWREPATGEDSSGTARIATRAWLRTIDLRTLPAGRYEVAVAVGRAGETPVAGRRRFARSGK